MTAITDTRKRSRDEDTSDFMPLSKRINNLHINIQHPTNYGHPVTIERLYVPNDGQPNSSYHQSPNNNNFYTEPVVRPERGQIERLYGHQTEHHQQPVQYCPEQYNPDLSEIDNPYYYSKNKLLYDLHMERQRRQQ